MDKQTEALGLDKAPQLMSDELEFEFIPAPKHTNLTSILHFQEFNLEESKREERGRGRGRGRGEKRQLDIDRSLVKYRK